MFNELREDLVLLYELKQACANPASTNCRCGTGTALARAGVLGAPPPRASARPSALPSQRCLNPLLALTPARTPSSMWWAHPHAHSRGWTDQESSRWPC